MLVLRVAWFGEIVAVASMHINVQLDNCINRGGSNTLITKAEPPLMDTPCNRHLKLQMLCHSLYIAHSTLLASL